MIITRDEAAKLMSQKIKVLLRFTKRPPNTMDNIELSSQRDGKTELIAKALVKSVREVDFDFFIKSPDRIQDHGVMSLNGLRHHISTLHDPEVWDSFVKGQTKLTRISIDYSLIEPSKGE